MIQCQRSSTMHLDNINNRGAVIRMIGKSNHHLELFICMKSSFSKRDKFHSEESALSSSYIMFWKRDVIHMRMRMYLAISEELFSKAWYPNLALALQRGLFDWRLSRFAKDLFICIFTTLIYIPAEMWLRRRNSWCPMWIRFMYRCICWWKYQFNSKATVPLDFTVNVYFIYWYTYKKLIKACKGIGMQIFRTYPIRTEWCQHLPLCTTNIFCMSY